MESPDSPLEKQGPWTSLWIVALVSLLAQLWLCQFFSFGDKVPISVDINPSNLWKYAYHFPPTGTFEVLNWLGVPYPAQPFNPLSIAAACASTWLFFTSYAPIISTLALLAMAAFLRELELSRPAALFGGVIYAWQGDLLPFVYPGHFGYITSWPFFAIAAWAALRAERTGHWAYPVISGACCGTMVGLLTNADRGAIASLLIAILYIAALFKNSATSWVTKLARLALCVLVAAIIALAPLLALFQSSIVGVKIAGTSNPEETYKLVTQYSLGPAETLTYLAPGFFGWHTNNLDAPYWGWIGEWPSWPKDHMGTRDMNLAISTTGTVATLLALAGILLLLPGRLLGPDRLTQRQSFYGSVLLVTGCATLILSWGWHTGLYRPLLHLPLMDKWRNPLKWLEMTNFALVVLSSLGLQQLLASLDAAAPETKIVRHRLAWFTFICLILVALGFLITYPAATLLAIILKGENYDAGSIANIMGAMHTSVFVALVCTALLCFVLRLLWQPARLRGVTLVNPWLHRAWHWLLEPEHLPLTLALAMAALGAGQLGWVASQFIEPTPLADLTASNPLLEALRSEGNRIGDGCQSVRVSADPGDPILNSLLQNQFSLMHISCLDISAASRIPDDLNTYLQTLEKKSQARLWLLAGVKNVVIAQSSLADMRSDRSVAANIDQASGYTLEPTGSPDIPSHAMVQMKDYFAKATLIPKAETFPSDAPLLTRLADANWNPRESVLINSTDPKQHTFPPRMIDRKYNPQQPTVVDLKTYTPTEIEIHVKSAKSGYLLINDQFDPDWQVKVDEQPQELLRADYIMRAIQVDAGESTITLHYAPRYRPGNLNLPAKEINLLSDAALLAAFLLAALALRRRPTPQPPA